MLMENYNRMFGQFVRLNSLLFNRTDSEMPVPVPGTPSSGALGPRLPELLGHESEWNTGDNNDSQK